MKLERGVMQVPNLDVDEAIAASKVHGHVTYVLPSTGITDRESFFDWARATLPQDPKLVSSRSWDAFRDSIRNGLGALRARRFLIIWPNSAAMGPPEERAMALLVFDQIAGDVADARGNLGRAKHLTIVVGS